MTVDRYRFRGSIPPAPHPPVLASLTTTAADGEATLRLYDVIDSWGGDWGISAQEVAAALDEIGQDVHTIHVRINSPGGEVWDAVAMMNALREHPARIVAHVDGIAASAASVIAADADETIMGRNSQLMIHDAWGVAMGPAASMRQMADVLDKISDDIAGTYARKAGGTSAQWRESMRAESWFAAEEAVAVGLADSILDAPADEDQPKATFDLGVFAHAGREASPAPTAPVVASAARRKRAHAANAREAAGKGRWLSRTS